MSDSRNIGASKRFDAFISYSGKDKSIADEVCISLESKGLRCWIAPRDIPGGDTWSGHITSALKSTKAIVLIFTSNTSLATGVKHEISMAYRFGVKLITFWVENVEPADWLLFYIESTQWVNAIDPTRELAFGALQQAILNHVNESPHRNNAGSESENVDRLKGNPDPPSDFDTTYSTNNQDSNLDELHKLAQKYNYEIVRQIGRGGMGIVYLANNLGLRRPEAIKVLNKNTSSLKLGVDFFEKEVQITAGLNSHNIVTVHQVLRLPGSMSAIAMEFVNGETLKEYVLKHESRVPIADALKIIIQIAQGMMSYMSIAVHRDIKPENIMISHALQRSTGVKIMDFGLAKVVDNVEAIGIRVGTPGYMAPEQIVDAYNVDIRADIYSLGCTSYFLLTGSHFCDIVRDAKDTVTKSPPPMDSLRSDIPIELSGIVIKMLAHDKTERYQKPTEIITAIEAFERSEQKPQPTIIDWGSQKQGFVNSLKMRFSHVPRGEFTMGSQTADRHHADDEYAHRVKIQTGFFLGIYPVTCQQFAAYLDATGRKSEMKSNLIATPTHPVVNTTYDNACKYCQWLSEVDGRVYSLPTEAEWEYASRGREAGLMFGFGDDVRLLDDYAHQGVRVHGHSSISPVGRYFENDLGLFDMHGNVWEWCLDWYAAGYYQKSPLLDPKGPDFGDYRVVRGGAWDSQPEDCRCAKRFAYYPDQQLAGLCNVGFRLRCSE